MVVSISEQIWSINSQENLTNHNLFIRHIRYVNNRLVFGDKRLKDMVPYEVLLNEGFCGRPIVLETEPDQESLGVMLETKPLELIYCGPTRTFRKSSRHSQHHLRKSCSVDSAPVVTMSSKEHSHYIKSITALRS